jgi:hypothetical protein
MVNIETEQNNPVFYLKINSTTVQHINIFFEWINIVSAIGADYYVVCDNQRLTIEITDICLERNIPIPKIIKSEREKIKPKIENFGIIPGWMNVAYALLTPFVHATENNIKYFWNIDADDTLFCCSVQKTVEILKNAQKYAINNGLNVFSLDMWNTVVYILKCFHWSFGVCFVDNSLNYFDVLTENIDIIKSFNDNIDWKFTALIENNKIKGKTFYVENLVFEHYGTACFNWKNKKLFFLYAGESIISKFIKKHDKDIRETPVNIPQDIVKFSVGELDFSDSISYRENTLNAPVKHKKFQIPSAPTTTEELWKCNYFENYIYGLFTFSEDFIIFMATADTHTPQNSLDKAHRILSSLGLRMDFANSFRYSYVAIIDSGIVKEEQYLPNKPLVVSCKFDENVIEVTSIGRNETYKGSINFKVNGIDNISDVRGLHILVYSKSQKEFIVYICADIYNSNLFNRRGKINAGILQKHYITN